MKLLPLHDGTWAQPVAKSPRSIYFAQTGGLDIPPDIGIRLISPDVTSPERKALFRLLGVEEVPIPFVTTMIIKKYIERTGEHAISLASSKRHLQFLYLTDHMGFSDGDDWITVRVVNQDGGLESGIDVYKHNRNPYGATELFKRTVSGPKPGDGAPGYEDCSFINEKYFEESPSTPQGQDLSWLNWLYYCSFAESYVRLVHLGKLLLPGLYVHKHRPEKFLGALKVNYENIDEFRIDTIGLLQRTTVLCQGSGYAELQDAYYPTTELLKRVGKLVEPGAFFPWLYLENTTGTDDAVPTDWKDFLTALKITAPTDLDFALAMLRYSRAGFPPEATSSSRSRLFDLYEHIVIKQSEASEDPEAATKVQTLFEKQRCIYIPTDAGGHTWAFPHECVWNAPQMLQTKHVLRLLYEPCHREDKRDDDILAILFKTTLGIDDCKWKTLIEELKGLKEAECNDIATLLPIYKALNTRRKNLPHKHQEAIRLAFENDALICAPSDDQNPWRNIAQCIWSTGAKLHGRASFNHHYESLKDFFVEFLGVKPVDLEMAISELKYAGGEAKTSVDALKESIWMVNSLLLSTQRPPSSEDVVGADIFPIKMPNGQITRGSATMEFCIVDRESLGQAFSEKVKLLDFGLQEVSRLNPFLHWAQLQDRFMSKSVREFTSFHGDEARLVSKTDRQISHRAYALLRIACHFRSPRTETKEGVHSLYDMLKGAEVYETSGISSDLKLTQDDTDHVVVGDIATLHIDEAPTGLLKVYLPRDKDDQTFVFVTTLGGKLFEWMMRQPSEKISFGLERGTKAIQEVLMAPRSRTDVVLEKNGIACIHDVEDTDEQVDSESESATSTPRLRAAEAAVHLISEGAGLEDSDVDDLWTPSRSTCDDNDNDDNEDPELHQSFRPFTPPGGRRPFGNLSIAAPATLQSGIATRASNTAYTALLERVINTAQNKTIPSNRSFGMSHLLASIPAGSDAMLKFDLQIASASERDCRVDAAGELYVFELLSGLPEKLPGFCRDNWQSNIRHYVTSHPKYADMASWSGWEMSDITYCDTAGVLTRLLIQQGYLDRDSWSGERPQYFIEVKTTTSRCDMPFFISKAQYNRMQVMTLKPNKRGAIYVIFRVYNLGQADMGLAVYVDPEALRMTNQLEFIGETWLVVPRQRTW